MHDGTATISYTFLLRVNVNGAPKEVKDVIWEGVRYRVGFGEEEEFN